MHPSSVVIDHAITGSDITQFMSRFNLSMDDLSELLSVPKNRLPEILQTTEPIKNVAIALLVRLYSENPELLPRFDIQEYYASLNGSEQQKLRHISICFGRDSSASYRWINKGRPMSDQSLSLGRLISRLPGGIAELQRLSVKEAMHRGVNPYKTGSWSKPAIFDIDPSVNALRGNTYRKRTKSSVPKRTQKQQDDSK